MEDAINYEHNAYFEFLDKNKERNEIETNRLNICYKSLPLILMLPLLPEINQIISRLVSGQLFFYTGLCANFRSIIFSQIIENAICFSCGICHCCEESLCNCINSYRFYKEEYICNLKNCGTTVTNCKQPSYLDNEFSKHGIPTHWGYLVDNKPIDLDNLPPDVKTQLNYYFSGNPKDFYKGCCDYCIGWREY